MKNSTRILLLTALSAFLLSTSVASARGYHHRHTSVHVPVPSPAPSPTPAPKPAPTPAPTPAPAPSPTTFQFGSFNGAGQTKAGTITGIFLGTGDDFTQDVSGLQGTLVVYWEPSLTAAQISSGSADSSLLKWAAEMKKYNGTIIFVVMDEMNLPENTYSGNPAAFKTAWMRAHNLFTLDNNVQFAYDPNVAFSGNPASNFVSYYPGDAYVDLIGLDGFNFGGQTFAQVFQSSIAAIKSDFPTKPFWILSTGTVDNPTAWIAGLKTSGAAGIVWFDYQQFAIPNSTLQTL